MIFFGRVITFFLVLSSLIVHAEVEVENYDSSEFNPSKEEVFKIPIELTSSGLVAVDIYTPDNDLVRTLRSDGVVDSGSYIQYWDGKDSEGKVVPDEAYIPVVSLSSKQGELKEKYDPRILSGGEITEIRPEVGRQGQISFSLDKPSRVLSRAGIKSGPMMKTISNWTVRNSGLVSDNKCNFLRRTAS